MNNKPDKPSQLRAAAEAQLAHAPEAKLTPRPAEELLHELQVYQIELEMQNEHLRQAQVELEESRDRYVDLYEFAPVGYLTLTGKGLISEINLTGSALFKKERSKLLNTRFNSFVAPEQLDRWNSLFMNVLQHEGSQSFDLFLRNGDGEEFCAYLDCKHHAIDGKPVVRITLSDITYWRQAEESMREWQKFVDCAHWGMTIGRLEDRTIKRTNPAYASMHGYTMEELQDISVDSLYAPESRADFARCEEILRTDGRHIFECVRLRKDGSKFPAMINVATVECDDGGTIFVASVIDITDIKKIEHKLRALYTHLQTVREEEKASIAREIHDDLGGTLTALKMEAYQVAEELSAHDEAMPLLEHIKSMAQLVDEATHVTRRIISGLRPSILDDLGLPVALEWQAAQFNKRTGIECRINCVVGEGCEQQLDKVRSINLFRIFQEALTNVARHSGASRVAVEFYYNDEIILLSVSDNGRGIQEERDGGPMHYGMLGMAERAEQLGGTIKFCGVPGSGLSVTVNLPLANNRKKEEA